MAKRIAQIALGYAIWLLSAILSLIAVLYLRSFIVSDLPIELLRVSYWSLRLWNYVGSVAVGLVWLFFVIVTEGYFRELADKTLLVMLKRAAQMLTAELLFHFDNPCFLQRTFLFRPFQILAQSGDAILVGDEVSDDFTCRFAKTGVK